MSFFGKFKPGSVSPTFSLLESGDSKNDSSAQDLAC